MKHALYKKLRFLALASLIFSSIILHGCIVAAVGAGVGALKWANAKKVEAQVKCNESYNTYLELMARTHKPPMGRDSYCNG